MSWYNPASWDWNSGTPRAIKYGGATVLGGPVGAAGVYSYEKQQQGTEDLKQGMQDAHDQLAALKKQQYDQRMADLNKAMGYFGPVDDLLGRMYGGHGVLSPQQRSEIAANPQARSGPGHFLNPGSMAPPPPAPPSGGMPSASWNFTGGPYVSPNAINGYATAPVTPPQPLSPEAMFGMVAPYAKAGRRGMG